MKKYLTLASSLLIASFAMQSCLDFDDPGDELGVNQTILDNTVYVGNIDSIPYHNTPTEAGLEEAIKTLEDGKYFGQILNGQYCMRGGKEGNAPGGHAYQRQFSLGTDNYAQYFTVPHKKFMYGSLTSTYNISAEFNGDPHGAYTMAKNAFMPALHHPAIDSIPEIKAIVLLYYCLMAQERADLSGPFTYFEDKQNSEAPYTYNSVKDIYFDIVNNLDTIVACLKNYENRPDWYKNKLYNRIFANNTFQTSYDLIYGEQTMNTYIKFANSLKLRMAMHIVKVEPETAKKWAEEAVASGVIERVEEQSGLFPMVSGHTNPLMEIANGWGDLRLSASFESLLMSLDHPYTKFLFLPNSGDIINRKTQELTPAGTRICGIRSGTYVGQGQTYAQNMRQAYSTFDDNVFGTGGVPSYFIKLAEVDFLRAEGALREWNMGGTAKSFYESGIRNADLVCHMAVDYAVINPETGEDCGYRTLVDAYMEQETPWMDENGNTYVNVDPYGDGPDWPSVTKIGVKWNDDEDSETKLEKIITQKYIALFPLSTEAWTELRRTGYPKLFPVLNTDDGDGSIKQGEMIRRIPWVPIEPAAINMVETSGIRELGGPDEQATRLWWDVDVPNI